MIMGLFSFVKSAGRLLGIGRADAAQDESKAPPPSPPDAEAIRSELDALGLPANDVQVQVEGDTVRLTGTAADAETREKLILAAGNVAGVAKVEEQIATAAPAPEPVFYTVKKGDTLSAIAKQHYGSANKYMMVFEANRPMLKDPDKIYPGQVLRIPPDKAA
jgi:nucleoid-associated protein YgaU